MTSTNLRDTEIDFISEALAAEADAIRRIGRQLVKHDREPWQRALDLLERCDGHVVVSGMGKSGLVGAKISATFSIKTVDRFGSGPAA